MLTHNGLRRLVVNVNMQYKGCWVAQQTLENGGTKGQHKRKIRGVQSTLLYHVTDSVSIANMADRCEK